MGVEMNIIKSISVLLCALGIFTSGSAMACSGDFYVVVMDADASPNLRVKSNLVDASGATDLLGNVSMPDSALGGVNTLYQFALLSQAYVDNTKVRITTDDTDCVIDSADEFLGNITDVQSTDF